MNNINEIEAALIKRRLQYLKAQGATGKRGTHDLDKSILDGMDDEWEFCSTLAELYAVKEVRKRRDKTDDDEPSYAQLVVTHLLLNADNEQEEQSDTAS